MVARTKPSGIGFRAPIGEPARNRASVQRSDLWFWQLDSIATRSPSRRSVNAALMPCTLSLASACSAWRSAEDERSPPPSRGGAHLTSAPEDTATTTLTNAPISSARKNDRSPRSPSRRFSGDKGRENQ